MRRRLPLAVLCPVLMAVAVAGAPVSAQTAPELDFRGVVREARTRVFPAVIYIRCVRASTEQGKQSSQQVSGSGVIISPDGEALTNWHVVDKAQSVRCLLSDGRPVDAEVLGTDKDTDLALLRLIPGDDAGDGAAAFPYAELGDSGTLAEGDFVMAMGAPFGLNRSVSIGIISCARRYLPDISEYSLWLQTDAAINPGNSGGPLVNTDGRVIGLNARGLGMAEDMGFAIPSTTIEVLLPQLRSYGRVAWSWSGLQLQPLRDFDRDIYFAETEGVIVAETDPESPGRRAGVKPRDRIVAIGGEPITALTAEDLPGVRRRLGLLPRHEPVAFDLVRAGEPLRVEITPREKGDVEGEDLVCERWDLTVKTINQFDNPSLFFHRKEGVFVYGLKVPGNAAASGLQAQDIILRVDQRPVRTLDDIRAIHGDALENLDRRHRMMFVVLRGGLMRHVVLDFSRDYSK